jgi:lantibiotic biosynthesis protein
LWLDLQDELLVETFVEHVSGRSAVKLVEVFPTPDMTVVTGPDGGHAGELLISFVRERSPNPIPPPPTPSVPTGMARQFAPGSRWLYAKLYGGVSSAERVLREAVAPVVSEALASGAASRWFFLRHHDPEPHLRVRLQGRPEQLWAETMPALERATAHLLGDGALWRIALDTYEREVERYGGPAGIDLAEEIFWRDSEAALAIIMLSGADPCSEDRWLLAVRSADALLAALGLSAAVRATVFAAGKAGLASEHRAGSVLRKAIGARWSTHRAQLTELLTHAASVERSDELAPGVAALAARDAALAPVAARLRELGECGALVPRLTDFAGSLVHMSCNRLLHASQRAQELLIYEFLRRHHAQTSAGSGG